MSPDMLLQKVRQLLFDSRGSGFVRNKVDPEVKAKGIDLLQCVARSYMGQPDKVSWDSVRDLEALRQQIQVDPHEEPPVAVSNLYYTLAYL